MKTLIFDFDDTITDNFSLDFKSFYFTCKKFGIKSPTKNKILKYRREGLLASDISKHIVYNSNKIDLDSFIIHRKKFLEKNSIKYLKLKKDAKKIFHIDPEGYTRLSRIVKESIKYINTEHIFVKKGLYSMVPDELHIMDNDRNTSIKKENKFFIIASLNQMY